jgi:hypothetical protein
MKVIKQVCNAWQRYKKQKRVLRSEIQQMLKRLKDHKSVYKFTTVGEFTIVQDIFWAHLITSHQMWFLESFESVI